MEVNPSAVFVGFGLTDGALNVFTLLCRSFSCLGIQVLFQVLDAWKLQIIIPVD